MGSINTPVRRVYALAVADGRTLPADRRGGVPNGRLNAYVHTRVETPTERASVFR